MGSATKITQTNAWVIPSTEDTSASSPEITGVIYIGDRNTTGSYRIQKAADGSLTIEQLDGNRAWVVVFTINALEA